MGTILRPRRVGSAKQNLWKASGLGSSEVRPVHLPCSATPFSVLNPYAGLHPEAAGWAHDTLGEVGQGGLEGCTCVAFGEPELPPGSLLSRVKERSSGPKRRRPLQFTMTNARRSKRLPTRRWNVPSVA